MATFVIRETESPELDLARNWSSFCGGGSICPLAESTEDAAVAEWAACSGQYESEAPEMRYHNGLEGWCEFHYEGLGAWLLDAKTLEEAMTEAKGQNALATTTDSGDGHFFAEDVVTYYHVEGNIYVFEIL